MPCLILHKRLVLHIHSFFPILILNSFCASPEEVKQPYFTVPSVYTFGFLMPLWSLVFGRLGSTVVEDPPPWISFGTPAYKESAALARSGTTKPGSDACFTPEEPAIDVVPPWSIGHRVGAAGSLPEAGSRVRDDVWRSGPPLGAYSKHSGLLGSADRSASCLAPDSGSSSSIFDVF